MFLRDIPNVRAASVIDVRNKEEFDLMHAKGSVNIPWDLHRYYLDELEELPKPWVFCCEEGRRAGFVVMSLKMLGFDEVYNVGRWFDIERELGELDLIQQTAAA